PVWRYEESPEIMLEENDVIFSKDGTLGNPAILRELKGQTTINATMMLVRVRKDLHPEFFYQILNTKYFFELIRLKVSGSSIPHLFQEDMNNFTFYAPNLKEQQKIGEFFKVLDERIANQERKISKVKALKEAYLTEMFPQEGETVPKRRFKGFQEEWEKMKIKDISPLRGGYGFKSDEFKESGIPILRISNILSNGSIGGNYIYTNEMEDESKFTLPNESIVIAMSGATTGKVATLQSENKKVYQNQRVGYFQPMKNINYSFISILVKTNKFTKQLNKVLVAGAQPNISSAQIDEFIFLIPNSIKEQQKIGEFFKNLDDQIRAEEAKLEKLKKMKEAYLEEMFV